MKKLILVASPALIAAVLAPVASAGAFTGACKIVGAATFTPALKNTEQTPKDEYKFKSTGGECKALPGEGEPKFEGATVSGKGNLSCLKAHQKAPEPGRLRSRG